MSLNKTCRLCYSCGWNACSERAVWQNDLLQFAHECPVFSNRISSHYTWLGDNNYHFQANVTKLITVYRAVKLQKLNMKTKTRGQISSIRCQEEKALCCCYDMSFFFMSLWLSSFHLFSVLHQKNCNHTRTQKKTFCSKLIKTESFYW